MVATLEIPFLERDEIPCIPYCIWYCSLRQGLACVNADAYLPTAVLISIMMNDEKATKAKVRQTGPQLAAASEGTASSSGTTFGKAAKGSKEKGKSSDDILSSSIQLAPGSAENPTFTSNDEHPTSRDSGQQEPDRRGTAQTNPSGHQTPSTTSARQARPRRNATNTSDQSDDDDDGDPSVLPGAVAVPGILNHRSIDRNVVEDTMTVTTNTTSTDEPHRNDRDQRTVLAEAKVVRDDQEYMEEARQEILNQAVTGEEVLTSPEEINVNVDNGSVKSDERPQALKKRRLLYMAIALLVLIIVGVSVGVAVAGGSDSNSGDKSSREGNLISARDDDFDASSPLNTLSPSTSTNQVITSAPTLNPVVLTPQPSNYPSFLPSFASPTKPPTPIPTSAPTERQLTQILRVHNIDVDGAIRNDMIFLQTWNYMSDEDDPPSGLRDSEVLERFIVIYFYYLNSGPLWRNQLGFLGSEQIQDGFFGPSSSRDVCDWNDGPFGFNFGIGCDSGGSIITVKLDSNNLSPTQIGRRESLPTLLGLLTNLGEQSRRE